MATRRRSILLASGLVAALGLALSGHGVYLYAKAVLAQWLLTSAWANTLSQGTPVQPWPWADHRTVARLWLPQRRPLVVLSGSDGSSLAFAPGHLPGSAMPGRAGHSVISAHRDTHFRGLQALRPGQRLMVERADGVRVTYEIVAAELMNSDTERLRQLDSDESWLTLMTCYPFDAIRPGGPWRYLLHARAVAVALPPPRPPWHPKNSWGVFPTLPF